MAYKNDGIGKYMKKWALKMENELQNEFYLNNKDGVICRVQRH